MLTGGRSIHHLRHRAPHARNTIFLPGFQAPGTRGGALVAGAHALKVHGEYVDVRARIVQSDLFSAHADQDGLLAWAGALPRSPKRLFLVHGEPAAADELRRRCEERFAYKVEIPDHGEEFELR
jgi:metallo-beta-lactamase family protein